MLEELIVLDETKGQNFVRVVTIPNDRTVRFKEDGLLRSVLWKERRKISFFSFPKTSMSLTVKHP